MEQPIGDGLATPGKDSFRRSNLTMAHPESKILSYAYSLKPWRKTRRAHVTPLPSGIGKVLHFHYKAVMGKYPSPSPFPAEDEGSLGL